MMGSGLTRCWCPNTIGSWNWVGPTRRVCTAWGGQWQNLWWPITCLHFPHGRWNHGWLRCFSKGLIRPGWTGDLWAFWPLDGDRWKFRFQRIHEHVQCVRKQWLPIGFWCCGTFSHSLPPIIIIIIRLQILAISMSWWEWTPCLDTDGQARGQHHGVNTCFFFNLGFGCQSTSRCACYPWYVPASVYNINAISKLLNGIKAILYMIYRSLFRVSLPWRDCCMDDEGMEWWGLCQTNTR